MSGNGDSPGSTPGQDFSVPSEPKPEPPVEPQPNQPAPQSGAVLIPRMAMEKMGSALTTEVMRLVTESLNMNNDLLRKELTKNVRDIIEKMMTDLHGEMVRNLNREYERLKKELRDQILIDCRAAAIGVNQNVITVLGDEIKRTIRVEYESSRNNIQRIITDFQGKWVVRWDTWTQDIARVEAQQKEIMRLDRTLEKTLTDIRVRIQALETNERNGFKAAAASIAELLDQQKIQGERVRNLETRTRGIGRTANAQAQPQQKPSAAEGNGEKVAAGGKPSAVQKTR